MKLSPQTRTRLLGIVPLLFFLAQGVHYWRIHQLGHLLWMCNIGSLVLALGLFFEKPLLVRVPAIWTVPGIFMWFFFYVVSWGVYFASVLVHVGGLIVAAIALKTYRMDRNAWRYAFGWSLLVQLISRFATAPDLNVNVAHAVQPGFERTFPSYWMFWLAVTLATAVVLWLSGLVWRTFWPAVESSPETAASVSAR
ncbi:MAG TPA: hypothetical protein VJ749_12290 [Pyrinomonadaceae bacterium]|jgi:hypothetical protein|nr:hypothetical protein [Pyrinomonadaceae bacterium]